MYDNSTCNIEVSTNKQEKLFLHTKVGVIVSHNFSCCHTCLVQISCAVSYFRQLSSTRDQIEEETVRMLRKSLADTEEQNRYQKFSRDKMK